jgi:hypothetical protein
MKEKYGKEKLQSNVIPFSKSFKSHNLNVTSTIAAIIAIKIEHPGNVSPEDFFIDQLETLDNLDILAFEDALENENIGITSNEAQIEAINDA